MDHWDNNTIDHQYRRRDHPHHHPSFSSTLLDHIYRSTDDSSDVSMRKKQNRADENRVRLENILVNRRKTADDYVRSSNPTPVFFKHSSSSSSDSSGGFSSSESDSFYKRTRSSSEIHRPKPIRTTVERPNNNNKVKSKAMKMYSDLKKVKQPISPGGRLATFLNSLFTGNAKKPSKTVSTTATSASSFSRSHLNKTTSCGEKTVSNDTSSTNCSSASSFSRSYLSKTTSSNKKPVSTATSSTTCSTASSFSRSYLSKTTSSSEKTVSTATSSASSYSRSCLSKTTSSSEKSKRSVRFCPVNVILDENSKFSGHNKNELIMEENRRVIEAAKELIRTYRMNKDVVNISPDEEEDYEDDDDGASCASSDLFELDNLSAIGIDRYREELPVYETTRIIV